jgi:hypothetical protein
LEIVFGSRRIHREIAQHRWRVIDGDQWDMKHSSCVKPQGDVDVAKPESVAGHLAPERVRGRRPFPGRPVCVRWLGARSLHKDILVEDHLLAFVGTRWLGPRRLRASRRSSRISTMKKLIFAVQFFLVLEGLVPNAFSQTQAEMNRKLIDDPRHCRSH